MMLWAYPMLCVEGILDHVTTADLARLSMTTPLLQPSVERAATRRATQRRLRQINETASGAPLLEAASPLG